MHNEDHQYPEDATQVLKTLVKICDQHEYPQLASFLQGAIPSFAYKTYDNWNGGTYYWQFNLKIPVEHFAILQPQLNDIESHLLGRLNYLDRLYDNDQVSSVVIAPGGSETEISTVDNSTLERIWGVNAHVKVFLSHKAKFKKETSALKTALAEYGIAAFVAHEDIHPTEEWMREIEQALSSMDALVALLTEDFHSSDWTDQEVGYAMGRGVPLIAVRLGYDPYGLMGKKQGLGGCSWDDPKHMASKIYELLCKRLYDKSRLFSAAVSAYSRSETFADSAWIVKNMLSKFNFATDKQIEELLLAYRDNSQNSHSWEGQELLRNLLNKWTDKTWILQENDLVPKTIASSDLPF